MKKIIDKVTPEMEAATQAKFDSWDEVVQNNLMEQGDEEQKAYVAELLKDPTIYAYAFFRNKEGEPFKLYAYQDIIINDPSKRVIFCAANQIGKSVSLCIKALHFTLTNPGKTVVMVSKTLPQSKDLLREIKRLLQTSTLEYKAIIGDAENKTEVYFKHYDGAGNELSQSRIICLPATEAALGYAVDLGLEDELAFYENGRHFHFQIFQPRTYTTKGQIIVFSNPNGQQGVFWDLWNDDDYSRYKFKFLDKPGNTLEEYNKLKVKLTQEEFDSTVNAVFTSPEGGFISLRERKAMQEERENFIPTILTQPVYIFFDWGKSMDRTTRCIGIPVTDGQHTGVYVYEVIEYPQGTPYNKIFADLVELVKTVGFDKVAMVGWDNTGVGRGVEDFIKRIQEYGVQAQPVEFSLENKSRIYTIFKLLIERNLMSLPGIKIPFIQECDKQLAQLRFKKSPRGYLQVHHENDKDRDDFPDCLAGLCSLIVQPDSPPVTVTRI